MAIPSQIITAAQVRAGRALLQITQEELAALAGISKNALNNFERGTVTPRPDTLLLLRNALDRAGIEFMGQTGVNLSGDPFKAQILEGAETYKLLLEDIFNTLKGTGRPLLASGLDERYCLAQDRDYFLGYVERNLKHGIGSRLLICEGDTELVEPLGHYRWLPKRLFHQVPYCVYGNKYAILLWGTPLRIVLIENKAIADSYRKQLNENWSNAKTPILPRGVQPYFHHYQSLVE